MSITAVIPQAPPDAYSLAEWLTALADLQAFYATHLGVPRPGDPDIVVLPVPVPGEGRAEQAENLALIAELLGVHEASEGGALVARRPFGPLVLEARVDAEPGDDVIALFGPGSAA